MIRVSVIIPNYNHASYLQQRIESVINQTFQDFELVILDDASTDGSLNVLNVYKNHKKISHFIVNEMNSSSPFHQWRQGIELAKGKYIWIAESDDFADPGFLNQTVEVLEMHPEVSMVYTDSQIVDDAGEMLELWSSKKNLFFNTNRWSNNYINNGKDEIINYLMHRTTINNASAVLYRREYLHFEGFLDKLTTFKNAGDLYSYLHMAFKGDIAYISSPLNNFRMHAGNITKVNMKSGLVYEDLMDVYCNTLDLLFLDSVTTTQNIKITKSCKGILGKYGFKLVDKRFKKSLYLFINKAISYGIFTKQEGKKYRLLFKIYSLNIVKIKGLAKKYLRTLLKRGEVFN